MHRDIKPSNVLLNEQRESRLGDFGLAARLPQDGAPLRTRINPHTHTRTHARARAHAHAHAHARTKPHTAVPMPKQMWGFSRQSAAHMTAWLLRWYGVATAKRRGAAARSN